MRQFLNGSDAAFSDLEQRVRHACIQFQHQEMPVGTSPAFARIGFEIDPTTSEALLLVQRGLRYTGRSEEVREWMRTGTKRFSSFAHLRTWIRRELAVAYQDDLPSTTTPIPNEAAVVPRSPSWQPEGIEEITDWESVLEHLPDHGQPSYISADALFQELRRSVLGQDDALKLLARRVSRHLARRTPSRPATVFALGPTGVGKTHTAESLSTSLHSLRVNYSYLRLDMSEYQESFRTSQLLGAPPGYIGYSEGAQLTESLINNPRTVVLFDEIEKAHRNVFQTLMNAMDAGRLSSPNPVNTGNAQSREIDCRPAIFFFTSNLDTASILKDIEEQNAFTHPTKIEEICRVHLRTQGLPPELIGRINTFLVFRPLMMETRAKILLLSIVRVAHEYGVDVAYIEPEVVTTILEQAHGEDFGARPDIHLIDDLLGTAFEEASRNYPNTPVKVCGGDQFVCQPLT